MSGVTDPRAARYRAKVARLEAEGPAPIAEAAPRVPGGGLGWLEQLRAQESPPGDTFTAGQAWSAGHVLLDLGPDGHLRARRRLELERCPTCGTDRWLHRPRDAEGYSHVERCPECGPLDQRVEAFNAAGFELLEGEQRPAGWALSTKAQAAWLRSPDADPDVEANRPVLEGPLDSSLWLVGEGADRRFQRSRRGEPLLDMRGRRGLIGRWMDDPSFGVMLCGSVGMGKTTLLTRAARFAVLEHGLSCRWVTWKATIDRIRASYRSRTTSPEAILEPLKTAQVVVIDEIGAAGTLLDARRDGSTANTDAVGHLESVMEHRSRAGLPLLLTTNLNSADLGARLSGRVADRIHGACEIVELVGDSYRRRGQ